MDEGPLVDERIAAGAHLLNEFQKYAPVQDAFWLKDAEEGAWWFYVASDQITDENFDRGYEEVGRLADIIPDPYFDILRVKLIGADHPLAQAAQAMHRRYPGRRPLRFFRETFGDMYADEGYIYPSPLAATVS
jgi:hypothetical protein